MSGRAVVAQPVRLDHEAEFGPVEVDLEAVQPYTGQWRPEPGHAGQRDEAALERRVGEHKRAPLQRRA
jgi:hypothetical protein